MQHPPKEKKKKETSTALCGSPILASITAVLKGKSHLDASHAVNHNHCVL